MNGNFDQDVDMDGLLQICGGIPLVLRIVGSHLRTKILGGERNAVSAYNDTLQYFKDWQQEGFEGGEEGVSESIVGFVYERLKEPCKQAFLDIAFFFNDWDRSKVADIVGEDHLRDLEAAALVTTEEKGEKYVRKTVVKMHDIVRATGTKLSKGRRITDIESLSVLLSDAQKLEQTKGIWLPDEREAYWVSDTTTWTGTFNDKVNSLMIEAKHVDFMSKSLRVLSLGNAIKIKGRCHRAFEDLRFLDIAFEDVFPLDLSKSSLLVYFESWSKNGQGFPQLPKSLPYLRLLHLVGPLDSPISLDIGELNSLRKLELFGLKSERFSFRNICSLQSLKLILCSQLKRLPENFGDLTSLQTLKMNDCSKLETLPESFGDLSSMRELDLHGCSMLKRISDSFGDLSSLQELDLHGCSMLERLPGSFGNLNSLKILKMNDCSKLQTLPESFVNLCSMKQLDLYGCSMLERLPESIGNLSSLEELKMNDCSKLQRLPQTFDQLSRLYCLEIDGCEKLCSLIDNIGGLKCLKFLSIRNCRELKRLPKDIPCSTSLAVVKAYGCAALEAKAIDSLVQIKSLMFLEIGESPMLIKRWQEILQEDRPLIGTALRLEGDTNTCKEIMSSMFFSGGSRFVQVDGEGQVAEVASSSMYPEVGVKVALLLTPWGMSDEVRQKVWEDTSSEFQIIYVDVDVEGETEESRWIAERDNRIKEALVQLPHGSRAWTSPFPKTNLLFAYLLSFFASWASRDTPYTSVVGTSVFVDEEGRRKLSPLQRRFLINNIPSEYYEKSKLGIKYTGDRRVRTFSPLEEAWCWPQRPLYWDDPED